MGQRTESEVEREAATVLAAPAGNPRFPLLDSLRGLAAIAVMLVHVGIFSGGFTPWYKQLFSQLDIGVPFFFLLSGFLLYRPMLAARIIEVPRQRIVDYARNRFFRIFPAFWVVLALTALVPGAYGAFSGDWWVYWFLLQNFPVFTKDEVCVINPWGCGVQVAWSLTIEVLFYFMLPFFAAGMAVLTRVFGRKHWFRTELVVLGLIAAVSLYIQSRVPSSDLDTFLFFSPIGRGWWFALGMGLAVFSVLAQQKRSEPAAVRFLGRHPGSLWLTAFLIYALTTIVLLDPKPSLAFPLEDGSDYLLQVALFGIVPLLVIIPAVFGTNQGGIIRNFLSHRSLVWFGLVSYGIFLWHFPVMTVMLELGVDDILPFARFPVLAATTFAGTLVMAGLSFYLVERPLMLWSRRQARPAG